MGKTRSPDFEKSLQELEELVEKLEHGDLPLDVAMRTYERGFALSRDCQNALQQAQARVDILNQRSAPDSQAEPFEDESEPDARLP